MTKHELKTWPKFFKAIVCGVKRFELRRNDRGFKVGDQLMLREWDPETEEYTGNVLFHRVTYLLDDPKFGVAPGFCVMSIDRWKEP